jgi:hypothetical protein
MEREGGGGRRKRAAARAPRRTGFFARWMHFSARAFPPSVPSRRLMNNLSIRSSLAAEGRRWRQEDARAPLDFLWPSLLRGLLLPRRQLLELDHHRRRHDGSASSQLCCCLGASRVKTVRCRGVALALFLSIRPVVAVGVPGAAGFCGYVSPCRCEDGGCTRLFDRVKNLGKKPRPNFPRFSATSGVLFRLSSVLAT